MSILKSSLAAILVLVLAGASRLAVADEPQPAPVSGGVTFSTSGPIGAYAAPSGVVMPAQAQPTPTPPAQPAPEKKKDKKDDKAKKDDGKKKDKDKAKKDSKEGETISRPTGPPEVPADPKELETGPDGDGLVRFNFNRQPWLGVLSWLARISHMSLDWLELPADNVNLTTQRRYSVAEARNLINRLLLDRGFTILCEGEVMSVVKLADLNPSKVPRAMPEDLDKHLDYEYMKVSFPLTRMVATRVVEELKPYRSGSGRLEAMSSTNRIEAMDAVINLRDIRDLLAREQSADAWHRPPWVKRLRYRRASEVVEQLNSLLGIEAKPTGPMSAAQKKALEQAMRQAAQQKGNKGASKPEPAEEIHLVADKWNNAVIAYAPPDKLAIIQEAVRAIDTPQQASASLEAMLGRVQRYHLSTMEPEPLVKALREIGNLGPTTELTFDADSKTIIASASLVDHMKIRSLVRQLDGTGRTSYVITLRRRAADYVAGTMRVFLFGGTGEAGQRKKTFSLYGSSRYGGSSSSSKKKEGDQFRVEADVANNQLLIWANEYELAEVKHLLVSLGENPDETRRDTVRVVGDYKLDESRDLLERLREAWPDDDNPLLIEDDEPDTPASDQQTRRTDRPDSHRGPRVTLVQHRVQPPTAEPGEKPARPPVVIRRNAAGELVITSKDPDALARAEFLMAKLAPPRKQYEIFPLSSANCLDMVDILEEYFKEEGGVDLEQFYRDAWYGRSVSVDDKSGGVGLSRRRPIRFIADIESNSVLVKDATPGQLKLISDLIKFYNEPKKADSSNVRQQAIFKIHYSDAEEVADTIKSIYRDLLSPNDKAFQNGNKGRQNVHTHVYRSFLSGTDKSKPDRGPKFKGPLSIGVNERANTLHVSATPIIFNEVAKMIKELDEAAKPTVPTVSVIKLGPGVSAEMLEKALSKITGSSSGSSSDKKKSRPKKKNRESSDGSTSEEHHTGGYMIF